MAIQRFKVSLSNARFPLLSTQAGRAVFVPQLDSQSRLARGYVGSDESADYNIAQVIYSENVMPVSNGIRSVGYTQRIAPTVNTDFDSIFALRDENENTVLYSPGAGKNYIYDETASAWTSTTHAEIFDPLTVKTGYDPVNSKVTYAYVDGKTFVCYSRLVASDDSDMSIMFWNSSTKALEPAGALIANLPFDAGTIDGISASNGYLIVYSGIEVAWAPFDGTAFNFTPYANGAFTGAGRQIPEDVQAPITAVISLAGGFLIFTSKNAIAASYHAQTLNAPWVFREVPDAGGLESYEQATVEGSLGSVVAYTTTGFQTLSLNSARADYPDVADFIAGRQIERYNFGSYKFTGGSTNLDFYVKVSNIANRYIVVSYGTFQKVYSFALVYDVALKRWGKLRMLHRDCFYWNYGIITGDLTYAALGDVNYNDSNLSTYDATTQQSNALVSAPHGLAFMKQSGEVVIANWSNQLRNEQDNAVAIIGRVQLSRGSNIQFNRVEVEGLKSGELILVPSYDGATLSEPEVLTTITDNSLLRVAGSMIDCKNFNLVVQGTFDLSTMIIEGTTSGKI